MELDRKELKRQAREAMRRTQPSFWAVTLVYFLMTTGVSLILGTIHFPVNKSGFSTMGLFASILYGLYAAVIGFGFTLWGLWVSRKLDPGLGSLTQGFSVAGRVIVLEATIYLRVVLFTLAVSFAASFLLMPVLTPLTVLLSVAVVGIAALIFGMRYALAPFLLADNPDAGPAPAIRHSVELMRGWTGEYFKLEFSFLGWYLINGVLSGAVLLFFLSRAGMMDPGYLQSFSQIQQVFSAISASALVSLCTALVTLPISLWVTPYIQVARAGFYDARLRHQRESAPTL